MSNQEQELGVLRQQIDSIDKQMHELLNLRATCAQQVAEVKQKYQGVQDAVFYRPEREAQVLRAVMERNPGPLDDKEVARLFREIMSVCLALEEPMKVAFLGPKGTFTQQAALKHFGQAAQSLPLNSLDQVFREVTAGNAHYGVVPIENSTEGVVSHTLDLFRQYNLQICGEVELPVHQHLLRKAGDSVAVARIYAHPQAFAQCSGWLEQEHPAAERIEVSCNAEAARRAAGDVGGSAALASDMAADLHDLQMVSRNVEDQPDSVARFLIIGDQDVGASGEDKTSILVSAHHEPGALYQLLEPFNRGKISLTRVETRSSQNHCLFYIDFEGHCSDDNIRPILRELEASSVELKLLGSYPRCVL